MVNESWKRRVDAVANLVAGSPLVLVMAILVGLAFLHLLSPVSYRIEDPWAALTVVLLFSVAAMGGLMLHLMAYSSNASVIERAQVDPLAPFTQLSIRRAYNLCLTIGLSGVLLRGADYFVYRNYNFESSFASQRLAIAALEMASGGSDRGGAFSTVAAILFGFALTPFIFTRLAGPRLSRRDRLLAYFCVAGVGFEGVVLGGAMNVGFAAIFVAVVFLSTGGYEPMGCPRQKVPYAAVALIGFGVVAIASSLFVQRIQIMFGDPLSYLVALKSASFTEIPEDMVSLVRDPLIGYLVFSIFYLCDYALQGFAEFAYVVHSIDPFGNWEGSVQLSTPAKFLNRLFDIGINYSAGISNPRPGKFQTFFGDVYIDFGLFGGVIEMALLGFVWGHLYRSRLHGGMLGLFMDPFARTVLLMGPMVNLLSGGKFYFLVGLFVSAVIAEVTLVRAAEYRG